MLQPTESPLSSDQKLRFFVQALPKTETHLHLEGALPYGLLHELAPEKFPVVAEFQDPGFRYPSFQKFEETLLAHAMAWFTSAERYHEAARAIFARHLSQNVRYVETSFHLAITQFIRTPGREIIAAIRAAVPPGLEVRIFAGMLRTDYTDALQGVIDDLENWDELDGVDLHGYEGTPTEPWTARVWQRLRDAGKVTKAHAGEFDGAHRVREAIEQLGVRRVQHGVRAVEDPEVVALAVAREATFDLCPLSNVKLRVVPSLAAHPLRSLMAAGVRCTVSTDDPLVLDNLVVDEYIALATEANFTFAELARLARNGWEVALVPSAMRVAKLGEIDELHHVFSRPLDRR